MGKFTHWFCVLLGDMPLKSAPRPYSVKWGAVSEPPLTFFSILVGKAALPNG